MHKCDDYKAKFAFWAKQPKVHPWRPITNLPHFGHKSFRSCEEMNQWKKELMLELARRGGAKWD